MVFKKVRKRLKVHLPSGSDHKRSHMGPSWGTSCFLSMVRIWSKVWMDGDKPPCTQKIYEEPRNHEELDTGTYERDRMSQENGRTRGSRVRAKADGLPCHRWWRRETSSRRSRCSISTRWPSRTCGGTRRRSRRPGWSAGTRGSPWSTLSGLGSAPEGQRAPVRNMPLVSERYNEKIAHLKS